MNQVLWQTMKATAENYVYEERHEHGERDMHDIIDEAAHRVARERLRGALGYVAFIEDDPSILWRTMVDKADCESIADAIFAFVEHDLIAALMESAGLDGEHK